MIPESIKEWNVCVQQAKKFNPNSKSSYGFVSGKVLKDARRCYCAMSFLKKK
jgi:hypothetical protein